MTISTPETTETDLPEFDKENFGSALTIEKLMTTFPDSFNREIHMSDLITSLKELRKTSPLTVRPIDIFTIKNNEMVTDLIQQLQESEPRWEIATLEMEDDGEGTTFVRQQVKARNLRDTLYDQGESIDKISLLIRLKKLIFQAKTRINELRLKIINAKQACDKKEEEVKNISNSINGNNKRKTTLQEQIERGKKNIAEWEDKSQKLTKTINAIMAEITAEGNLEQLQNLYEQLAEMFDCDPVNIDLLLNLLGIYDSTTIEIEYNLVDRDTREKARKLEEQIQANLELKRIIKKTKNKILINIGVAIFTIPMAGAAFIYGSKWTKERERAEKPTPSCTCSSDIFRFQQQGYKNIVEAKSEARGFVKTMQDKGIIPSSADTTAIESAQHAGELENAVIALMGKSTFSQEKHEKFITIQPSQDFYNGLSAIHGPLINIDYQILFLAKNGQPLTGYERFNPTRGIADKQFATTFEESDLCRLTANKEHKLVMKIEHENMTDGKDVYVAIIEIATDELCK